MSTKSHNKRKLSFLQCISLRHCLDLKKVGLSFGKPESLESAGRRPINANALTFCGRSFRGKSLPISLVGSQTGQYIFFLFTRLLLRYCPFLRSLPSGVLGQKCDGKPLPAGRCSQSTIPLIFWNETILASLLFLYSTLSLQLQVNGQHQSAVQFNLYIMQLHHMDQPHYITWIKVVVLQYSTVHFITLHFSLTSCILTATYNYSAVD